MTSIERAARALCRHDGHPESVKFEGKPMWQRYVPTARAVLTAIREPSEAMEKAADDNQAAFLGSPVMIWHQMIDAALAEEG